MNEHIPYGVNVDELATWGFEPVKIRWLCTTFDDKRYANCRDFDVEGRVPRSSGLYVFVLERHATVDVRYVGRTSDLPMVTLGKTTNGQPRGGQRYGRPKHSGDTRRRVNAALTSDASNGAVVGMWLRRFVSSPAALASEEETLISHWRTRFYGLNLR
jgi:hypothetical protein